MKVIAYRPEGIGSVATTTNSVSSKCIPVVAVLQLPLNLSAFRDILYRYSRFTQILCTTIYYTGIYSHLFIVIATRQPPELNARLNTFSEPQLNTI